MTRSKSKSIKLFGYGSLNKDVIQGLTGTKIPEPRPAFIKHHVRIFAGYSKYWNGAVASLYPFHGKKVWGSVVELNHTELAAIDAYEGVDPESGDGGYYKRVRRAVYVKNTETGKWEKHITQVYIKTDPTYESAPSVRYINSIKNNLLTVGNADKDPIDTYGIVYINNKPVLMQLVKRSRGFLDASAMSGDPHQRMQRQIKRTPPTVQKKQQSPSDVKSLKKSNRHRSPLEQHTRKLHKPTPHV